MNSFKLLTKLGLLAAVTGVASSALAQSFTFDIDDTNGHTNYTGVGASGTVDFTNPAQVTVVINNDNTASSFITGFYILKPIIDSGPTQLDATALSSYTDSANKTWNLDNDGFGNVLNEFYKKGSDYTGDYFGAEIKNNPPNNGLPNPSTHTFTFAMDTSGMTPFDWIAYDGMGLGDGAVPHIFVRWQEVNNGDSAKGYDVWGDIPPPPTLVPEPSEIAAMGLLGMLGMLWTRRWFMNRKKK